MATPGVERWRVLAPYLDRALDLSGDAREAFLADLAASDGSLAADLRELLSREAEVGHERFLETDLPHEGLLAGGLSSRPGERLGAYTLERILGHGGMGTIWLAFRSDGTYESKVAIKLVKPGLDSRAVLARFDSERQILARMNHPNIARVLDAGTAADGRPYFVMEFVPGRALTEYCDDKGLTIRRRLDLFLAVCDAVQHAHRNGIIHRDLKPSNILIAEQDGRVVPKIIDFGIAKAVEPRSETATDVTREGHWIGTPAYMSPEQYGSTRGAVDTRSDVYALGVVLHELLVGSRPPAPWTESAAPRDPSDGKVTPPTARLGDGKEGIAARRGTDPNGLERALKGDLDWIVMKAIDPEPNRRYESPAALAGDIERSLAGLPVAAGPPSAGYRAGKFVKRHRVGVTFAAAALLALVTFAVATAVQSARIARERDRANREATTAKRALQVLTEIFEVSDPSEARGSTVTAREILDRGASKIDEEMADEPLALATLSLTVGKVYESLGLFDSAKPYLEKSLALRRKVLGDRSLEALYSSEALATLLQEAGKLQEAEPYFREVLAGRMPVLGADDIDTLEAANNLGLLLKLEGKLPEAETYVRQAVEGKRRTLKSDDPVLLGSLNNLGLLLQDQGKLDEAEPYLREVVEGARRSLGNDHPHTLTAIANMGLLLQSEGKLVDAEPYWREVLATRRRVLGNDHPQTILSIYSMGYLLRAQGRLDAAEPYFLEALERSRRVLGNDHPRTLIIVGGMGGLLLAQGKLKEAETYDREAAEGQRRVLGVDHSSTILATSDLAAVLAAEGKLAESDRLFHEVVDRARRVLGDENPTTLGAMIGLADVYTSQSRPNEAEPVLRRVLEVARRKLPAGHRVIGRALRCHGRCLTVLGRYTDAEAALVEAQGILAKAEPVLLPRVAGNFVDLYARWGKPEKAAEWRQKARQ